MSFSRQNTTPTTPILGTVAKFVPFLQLAVGMFIASIGLQLVFNAVMVATTATPVIVLYVTRLWHGQNVATDQKPSSSH